MANILISCSGESGKGGAVSRADGSYVLVDLVPGTFVVRTLRAGESGLIDQVFDRVNCLRGQCPDRAGTPVTVKPEETTPNINFALARCGPDGC